MKQQSKVSIVLLASYLQESFSEYNCTSSIYFYVASYVTLAKAVTENMQWQSMCSF